MTSPASLVSLALGGLVALAAAMGIGRFVYTPILPFMVEALGLSTAQAGLIASANFAGYLAGALTAATPLLRGSPRGWLLGAIAGSALTTHDRPDNNVVAFNTFVNNTTRCLLAGRADALYSR